MKWIGNGFLIPAGPFGEKMQSIIKYDVGTCFIKKATTKKKELKNKKNILFFFRPIIKKIRAIRLIISE